MTTKSRTMKYLRDKGIDPYPENAESIIQNTGPDGRVYTRKHDLWNIFDILSLQPGRGIVGIQACGANDFQSHIKTLMIDRAEETTRFLLSGGIVELWKWRSMKQVLKSGKKGTRDIWTPKICIVSLDGMLDTDTGGIIASFAASGVYETSTP